MDNTINLIILGICVKCHIISNVDWDLCIYVIYIYYMISLYIVHTLLHIYLYHSWSMPSWHDTDISYPLILIFLYYAIMTSFFVCLVVGYNTGVLNPRIWRGRRICTVTSTIWNVDSDNTASLNKHIVKTTEIWT